MLGTRGSATARYRDVFGVGEFRVLFAAQLSSLLGDVVAAVALMVLVFQRTHSPGLAALTMSLEFIPYLFGGTLMSAVVERWPPRATLVVCHVVSAALVAAMATPGIPVPALLALLFAVGLFAPVFQGVRAALLPQVLEPGPPYVLGRSVMRLVAQLAQIVGYAAGGALLLVISARGALVIDAASFAVSAALVRFGTAARPAGSARLPTGAGDPEATQSLFRASFTSLRRVFSVAPLRRVLLLEWVVPSCAVAPEALAAAYVAHLGRPPSDVGLYLTAMPVGAVVADVVAGRLLGPRAQARLIFPAALLAPAALCLFALDPALLPAMVVLFFVGLGFAYGPGLDQRLVDVAPAELLPAALAVGTAGLMFFQGVGFAVWGFAAELAPLGLVVTTAGVIALLSVLRLLMKLGRSQSGQD